MWGLACGLLLAAASPQALLERLDARQHPGGDSKALIRVHHQAPGEAPVTREALVFRRGTSGQLLLLLTVPGTERGAGALRVERGLWSYAPRARRWTRRGEGDPLAGLPLRAADLDAPRLAEQYVASAPRREQLGALKAERLVLRPRPGVAVPSPLVHLWVDPASGHLLKRQDFTAAGELRRTVTFARWQKLFSESKGETVWYPAELRVETPGERGEATVVTTRSVDLRPLPPNLFTRAWLESQSR